MTHGKLFYRPQYYNSPTYSNLTIRTYSNDDSTYVEKTITLQNGRSYTITADDATTPDYIFSHWTESTNGILSNVYSQKTNIIIQKDETISSHYKLKNTQIVEIVDGVVLDRNPIETNKWKLFIGETVYIKAIEPEENLVFVGWIAIETGGKATGLSQASSQYTKLYVGNQPIRIRAVYKKPEELTSYKLTIINGSSSGKYKETSKVAIQANYPDNGWEFYKWDGADEVFQVPEDKYKANPTIIMPPYPITLTAIYKVAGSTPVYTLIVNYGTIIEDSTGQVYYGTNEEDFEEGTIVTIKANELDAVAAQNSKFYKWVGNTENIANVNSETTTITIGQSDVTVNATYIGLKDYVLTVKNGTGTGAYKENARANIIANLINDETHRYEFLYWSGDTQYIDDINIKDTYVTMPDKDISVTAEYITKYFLEVTNGTNSGFYVKGTEINIAASENFVRWTGDIDYISNIYAANITITMPDAPIHITAILEEPNNPNSYGTVNNIENITSETLSQISGESNVGNIIIESETGNIGVQTNEDLKIQYVRKSISPKELSSSENISSINIGDLYIIKGE